jgi:hypothetical protein
VALDRLDLTIRERLKQRHRVDLQLLGRRWDRHPASLQVAQLGHALDLGQHHDVSSAKATRRIPLEMQSMLDKQIVILPNQTANILAIFDCVGLVVRMGAVAWLTEQEEFCLGVDSGAQFARRI